MKEPGSQSQSHALLTWHGNRYELHIQNSIGWSPFDRDIPTQDHLSSHKHHTHNMLALYPQPHTWAIDHPSQSFSGDIDRIMSRFNPYKEASIRQEDFLETGKKSPTKLQQGRPNHRLQLTRQRRWKVQGNRCPGVQKEVPRRQEKLRQNEKPCL